MTARWTNAYAIQCDLSMVQGRVPGAVRDTLAAGDKPSVPKIVEETEEEFFKNCTAEGDFEPPDLYSIKCMLDMVRDIDVTSDSEDSSPANVVQISKLKELTVENLNELSIDNSKKVDTKNCKLSEVKKVKKRRNIAVESILAIINSQIEPNNVELKLLKPNDFKLTVRDVNSSLNELENVNSKVFDTKIDKDKTAKKECSPRDRSRMLTLDPTTMFRKKVPVKDNIKPCSVKEKKTLAQTQVFIPSTQAKEYYQQYLARSRVNQMVREDLWSKAERQMKEIDEKRKAEAELRASEATPDTDSTSTSSVTEDQKLDPVRLPMHRHQLTGECKVCQVMCKDTRNTEDTEHNPEMDSSAS